jgi:hypothetical protein
MEKDSRVGPRATVLAWCLLTALLPATAGGQTQRVPANQGFSSVRKILETSCAGCHGWAKSVEGIGDASLVVPGDPEASPMYRMIVNDAMPMAGDKLSADQKALIRAWIQAGASKTDAPIADTGPAAPSSKLPPVPPPPPDRSAPHAAPPPLALHEVSGFASGGLLLAAGAVGIWHFLSAMAEGHNLRDNVLHFQEDVTAESVRSQAITQVWNDPSQQTLRWVHVGLLAAGETLYLYNAGTGIGMFSSGEPGKITRGDIHRYAFFTHAALMAAQVALGFLSTYALQSGSHDMIAGLGGAHAVLGIAIPAIMIGAGVLNILPP